MENKFPNKLFQLIIIIAVLISIAYCKNAKTRDTGTAKLNIEFSTGVSAYIYLYRITPVSAFKLDSVLANKSLNISFEIPTIQSPDIYLLRLSPKQSLMFIAQNGETVNIHIDPETIPLKYQTQNSKGSMLINVNNTLINNSAHNFDSVYNSYRNYSKDININELRAKTDSNLKHIEENLYYQLKSNIEQHPSNLSSIIALYSKFANSLIFDTKLDSSLFQLVADSCINKFPNNTHSIALAKSVMETRMKFKNIEKREQILEKGYTFKNYCLTRLDETNYCIYNSTAKYKIIYLWRAKDKLFWDINPKLKKLYKLYPRETLEIIGISAEKDKLIWRNYCNMERLNWINLIAEPNQLNEMVPNGVFPRIYILDSNFTIIRKDPKIEEIKNLIH